VEESIKLMAVINSTFVIHLCSFSIYFLVAIASTSVFYLII